MRLSAAEIASAVGGKVICGNPDAVIENITTDSHKLKGNDIFVPIKGARVDAHKFIKDVIDSGAAASFTAYELSELRDQFGEEFSDAVLIKVDDTIKALQSLGAYYRDRYVKIPYIGVTGSVGKTTVREMIATALSAGFKVYSTKGNANSQTGVPITVSETDEDAGIGVIEMGISEFGEMSRISQVVQCDMAVFTIVGVSHIGNLGSQENIMREKLRICEGMRQGGTLILNGDDEHLSRADIRSFLPEGRDDIRIVYYGTKENSQIRAAGITEKSGCAVYDLIIDDGIAAKVSLNVPGMHMVLNSLAALAAAYYNGVDVADAAEAVASFSSLDGRGRVFEKNGITVINDAYNAAPQSMKAGLKVLDSLEVEGRKFAVLADMLELGPDEEKFHREVGEYIPESTPGIDIVMLYGKLSINIADGIKLSFCNEPGRHMPWIYSFNTIEELKTSLKNELTAGDAVLFKGSNSMKLGSLVKELFGE